MGIQKHSKIVGARLICLCLAFGISLLYSFRAGAQLNPQLCKTTHLVLKDLQDYHYSPPVFDAATRKEIIKLMLENIDPKGNYFLSSDEQALDEAVVTDNDDVFCEAIEKCASIYLNRNKQTDSLVSKLLSAPLEFNTADTIIYKPHQPFELQDDFASLRKLLLKRLKFNVLLAVHDLKKDSTAHLNDKEAEEKARVTVLKRFRKHELHADDMATVQKYVAEKCWNAMARRCDPHSDYFNLDEKVGFDKRLSTQELSYGLVIKENDNDEIEIVKLIPGSPAWKANELNEGDVITGITAADGKNIDLSLLSEDEIGALIESASTQQLQFSVRKKNNNEKKVKLTKAKIESETNVLNGYILKDSTASAGYIPLPAFYSNYESNEPLGCANDVAKEILKLKKENIKGLILDLRDNGGGSLTEAMNLAGIFIDEGPLAVIRFRDKKPMLLRDMNRGTVFDRPLVILINGASASASEFLSEVLQDYKRAVLVGGTTYGKGTGQDIILVDSMERNSASKKSGFLKLTEMKFYRVTDLTNQSIGVIPDISLPDIYMFMDYFKEAKEPYHLLPDTVSKKVMYNANADLPLNFLNERSKNRVAQNVHFNKIKDMADSISALSEGGLKIALNKKSVEQYLEWIDNFDHRIEKLSDYESQSFEVTNNQYLDKILALDADKKDQNAVEIKDIKSDATLEEAYLILKDLINYSNTHTK